MRKIFLFFCVSQKSGSIFMSGESQDLGRILPSSAGTDVRRPDRPTPAKRISRQSKKVIHQDIFYVNFPDEVYDQ